MNGKKLNKMNFKKKQNVFLTLEVIQTLCFCRSLLVPTEIDGLAAILFSWMGVQWIINQNHILNLFPALTLRG